MPKTNGTDAGMASSNESLAAIRDDLRKLRFGSISITVHDGRIVQLDITEKRRLAS